MTRLSQWLALLLIALATFLYIPSLTRIIEYDEAYTLSHYAFSPVYALLSYTLPNNHILNSFLVWLFTSIAGKSEIAVRFPAFIAGLLSLALVYRLGWRYFGQIAGLIGATLMASVPIFMYYAVSSRGYALSILLTLSLVWLISGYRHRSRAHQYGIIATCAGLILTLPSLAVVVAAVGAWVLVRHRSAIAPMIVGTVIGGMFYAVAFSKGIFHDVGGGYFGLSTPLALLTDFLEAIFLPLTVPGVLLGLFFLVGAGWLLYRRHKLSLLLAAIFVVPVVLALAQWIIRGDLFFGRNYLFYLGPMALLAGYGLEQIFRKGSIAFLAIILAARIGFMPSVAPDANTPLLITRIEANLRPGESVIIGNELNEPVWYYLGHEHPDWFAPDIKRGRIYVVETQAQRLSELLAEYGLNQSELVCNPVSSGWEPFQVDVCSLPQK